MGTSEQISCDLMAVLLLEEGPSLSLQSPGVHTHCPHVQLRAACKQAAVGVGHRGHRQGSSGLGGLGPCPGPADPSAQDANLQMGAEPPWHRAGEAVGSCSAVLL